MGAAPALRRHEVGVEGLSQVRDEIQAAPKGHQVAGRRRSRADAADDALQIRHLGQDAGDAAAANGGVEEEVDTVLAAADLRRVEEGLAEPASQQAGAHCRARVVDDREEGGVGRIGSQGGEQLQVASGDRVQAHEPIRTVVGYTADLGQESLLVLLEVGDDGAGRHRRWGQASQAQPVQ